MYNVSGVKPTVISKAEVGVVLTAPVKYILDKQVSELDQVVFWSTLGHQTAAPYAIIGRTVAVYIHRMTFGESPHVLLVTVLTW